jgi:hypothetical protein
VSDLDVFLRIIEQTPVGEAVSVNHIRTEIEAAQLKPSSLGGLFRAACTRGLLTTSGTAAICRTPSRKGGRALVYTRTEPDAA